MTDDDFRDIALSMNGAVEGSHMGHPDFRANGRIFATLRMGRKGHSGDEIGMVKLSPEEQREVMRDHPRAFEPSPGAWGRQGCTDVRLEAASRAAVRGAMVLAWEAVVAKPPAQKRRAKKKPGKLILVFGGLGLLGALSGLTGMTVSGQTGEPLRAPRPSEAAVAHASTSASRSGRCCPTDVSAATARTPPSGRPSSASTLAKERSRTSATAGRSSSRAILRGASSSAESTRTLKTT